MRKPVFLILTNAIIVVAVFLLLARSLVVAQRGVRPTTWVGQVSVQHAGQGDFLPLGRDAALHAGDVVRTGPLSSAEFKWSDGVRWKLEPQSSLTLRQSSFNSVHKAESTLLNLSEGKVLVRVPKKLSAASRFEVQTSHVVASVKGTVFAVAVSHCRTVVEVYRGSVDIRPAGQQADAGSAITRVQQGQQYRTTGYGDKTAITPLATTDFDGQPTITTPLVKTEIFASPEGEGVLRILTEAGDNVAVDGNAVKTGDNGVWLYPIKLKAGPNHWAVKVTDIHGDKSQQDRSYNWKPKAAKTRAA